jgi:hypothetical protein
MGVYKMKNLYIIVCWLFFFNSFAYAEKFLNTTRVTVTGDLTEAVKVAKDIKKIVEAVIKRDYSVMVSSSNPPEIIFLSSPPSNEVMLRNRKKITSLESMKRIQKRILEENLWVIKDQVLYKKIPQD